MGQAAMPLTPLSAREKDEMSGIVKMREWLIGTSGHMLDTHLESKPFD